ncbi:hypothetical protein J6590_105106 [Homalodisca vitripennis]|nr:hypothetical protein J6590_105106 [Homalodisca vitripennis]
MKGIVSRSRAPYPAVGQSVVEKLPNIVVPVRRSSILLENEPKTLRFENSIGVASNHLQDHKRKNLSPPVPLKSKRERRFPGPAGLLPDRPNTMLQSYGTVTGQQRPVYRRMGWQQKALGCFIPITTDNPVAPEGFNGLVYYLEHFSGTGTIKKSFVEEEDDTDEEETLYYHLLSTLKKMKRLHQLDGIPRRFRTR